ncbi:MAG: hypothetical protein IPQ18_14570 [Saprospiraceae bacterium]|nr:hypothetical protein [Saprospiraceae bacterium]
MAGAVDDPARMAQSFQGVVPTNEMEATMYPYRGITLPCYSTVWYA